jgi:hypothetical protein
LVGSIYLALLLAVPPGPTCAPELFRIGRSTNANEVVYAARTGADGKLDPEDPIEADWHMLAEDGHREGLNFIEKLMAYGFSVDPGESGDGFTVILKAKKDRPVRLTLRAGCPAAVVTIAGRPALLRRIFVQAESGGSLIPSVAWADLEGTDPVTGSPVKERVVPE